MPASRAQPAALRSIARQALKLPHLPCLCPPSLALSRSLSHPLAGLKGNGPRSSTPAGGPSRVQPHPSGRHCGRDRHPADLQLQGTGAREAAAAAGPRLGLAGASGASRLWWFSRAPRLLDPSIAPRLAHACASRPQCNAPTGVYPRGLLRQQRVWRGGAARQPARPAPHRPVRGAGCWLAAGWLLAGPGSAQRWRRRCWLAGARLVVAHREPLHGADASSWRACRCVAPACRRLQRSILADKPRVTKFNITWDSAPEVSGLATSGMEVDS